MTSYSGRTRRSIDFEAWAYFKTSYLVLAVHSCLKLYFDNVFRAPDTRPLGYFL